MEEVESELGFRERASGFLDRMENMYLRILRGFILLFATALILYAGGLAAVSLFKISRSPSSVVEEPAAVAAEDLIQTVATSEARAASVRERRANPEHQRFYRGFLGRYHALFRRRFEPFRQREDQPMTRRAFDEAYLDTQTRLQAIANGERAFETDRADLEMLLAVMTQAAQNPETLRRLRRYRNARKVRVCRDVQRTRTTYRTGWDRYSTACSDWFYPPYGCAARRAVSTPYTQQVCSMQFPEGTRSHADIFRDYHEGFFRLLSERREANAANANYRRDRIAIGNVEGSMSLNSAAWIFGGFLLLMFFFLLVAIERHQRSLVRMMDRREAEDAPA